MADPVSSIPNLGPAADREYARAGITGAEQLRGMGADAAYLAALKAGAQPHVIGYYALVVGLQGRPWHDCGPEEKAALRPRFDALKAQLRGAPQGIEAILDAIGTGARRGRASAFSRSPGKSRPPPRRGGAT